MSQTPQTPSQPAGPSPSNISPAFALAIMALMLLIIATLSALWFRERSGRVAAQRDLAALTTQYQNLQRTIGAFLGQQPPGLQSARPIDRDDLTPQGVTLDGKARTAYTISAKAGERIGFQSGDVILIAPAVTTQPGTIPIGG